MKVDVDAVVKLLIGSGRRRGYRGVPTFPLAGVGTTTMGRKVEGDPANRNRPGIEATVPLRDDGGVKRLGGCRPVGDTPTSHSLAHRQQPPGIRCPNADNSAYDV